MQGMGAEYDMYDEMYYDQAAMMQAQQQQQMQMQQEYYGEEEDEDGMQGLYVEGLADRIWDDNEQ